MVTLARTSSVLKIFPHEEEGIESGKDGGDTGPKQVLGPGGGSVPRIIEQ